MKLQKNMENNMEIVNEILFFHANKSLLVFRVD